MSIRPLFFSSMAAMALLVAALAVSILTPIKDSDASTVAPNSTVTASSITLAKPAPVVKAHASSGYVHQANCMAALQGANGDNDIQAWMSTHTPTGVHAWGWSSSYTRYRGDRFVQYIDFYNNYPTTYWGTVPGFCMGDDSSIVDKVGDAPAGW